MPSIKPKIQGYVEEEIFQAFQQWKAEQGIESISDALNELLKRFFGFEKATPPSGGLNKEEIEALIEVKLAAIHTWVRFAEEKINEFEWRLKMEPGQSPLKESGAVKESKGDYEKSPLEERNWKAGNIWCDPSDMEPRPQKSEEQPPLSSLEQEDLEANPLPIPPQSPEPPPISIRLTGLKQAELERRLKIAKGTLTKRRNRPDFKEWSRERDPNGVGWQWDAIARKYLAVE